MELREEQALAEAEAAGDGEAGEEDSA